MTARTKETSRAMDDVVDQLRVLILRQVQLDATAGGEHPPPIPAKLITPLMTRVLSFQLPDVSAALEMVQAYLLDLCEAASLSLAALINDLAKVPAVFDPASKAHTAARQLTLVVLQKSLAPSQDVAAGAPAFWDGLQPHHLAFIVDGLMLVPPFDEFAEYASDISGSNLDISSTTVTSIPFKKSQARTVLERSLALLSGRHLVPLVNLVLERLGEKAAGSGAFSGMLSSAFQFGSASSSHWTWQATLLGAVGAWSFSFLDADKQEVTRRLLQAVWEFVIPEAQRSSQRRVILVSLTEIWRTLSKEVRASPRAAAEWADLAEQKALGPLFELQEHFVATAQKWIRKQKIRKEALSLLQVLLCHGKPELFKSKHRGFFVTALVAACNDAPSRGGALPVGAAYLEQAPEALITQIREVWKAEVVTVCAAAFPKRAACLSSEMPALTAVLTGLARTELKLGVTTIEGILTSSRHHPTQKAVALRAVKALMIKHTASAVLDLDTTLLPTILSCIADKTEPSLAAEGLLCLPPVWSLLPPTRSAAAPTQERNGKASSAQQQAVGSRDEVLDALEALARAADRGVASTAIRALRDLAPLLSVPELLRALKIHAHAATADLHASVERWTIHLDDVRRTLADLTAAIQAAGRQSDAGTASPSSPLVTSAQWCESRVRIEGLCLVALMHPDKQVWDKARGVVSGLNAGALRKLEVAPDQAPSSTKALARVSAPEAALSDSENGGERLASMKEGRSEWEDGCGSDGGEQPSASIPFLADSLLVGQPQGLDAEVWARRGSGVGVAWAPELWPLVVQQSDRYPVCIEWAWSRVRKHRAKERNRGAGEDVSSAASVASSSPAEERAEHSVQVQRNHVYFLCLCMRESQHVELDLDEAAKGRKRQVFQWADVTAKPGLPLMASKGVTARRTTQADDEARAWLKKRRMTRAAVRECLQQVWEHLQSVYEGVGGDEKGQLLQCVDAIHPSCYEDLILELKRYQTQQRLGPTPLSATLHHSSGAPYSGSTPRKTPTQLPGSPTKRHDGTFEFQKAGTSDFYYQENVLYVLAGLYARTSPEDYRAAPAPVRSALEEFVGAWTREQDLSGFAGLSLKVRMYAVRIIELYLLYTTAAVQAAVTHTGASGADRAEQEAAFVPSLAYRTNVFKCLTVQWSHGLAPSTAQANVSKKDGRSGELVRRTSGPGGRSSDRPSSLEDAVAKGVAALISMGPLKDRDFENNLLRYLQTYHARSGPGGRAQVVSTMAVFLRHNPHRVRSFIAGSFAQLHRALEKEEAAALALTYFRALARSVESELEEWLTVRSLHPAKILHLCLLHMTSPGESFRHVALELLATLESIADRPAALLQGVLPAHADGPPDLYLASAVTTSVHLAEAHPEYSVAMVKEALSLQQILPKDVIPTILTLIQPWAANFAAVLRAEQRKEAAPEQERSEADGASDTSAAEEASDERVRSLVERIPNLQNLRSSYTEEEEELTSPLPMPTRISSEADRRGSAAESGRGGASGGQRQDGGVRNGAADPGASGRGDRSGSSTKDTPSRKSSLEVVGGRPAAESSGRKGKGGHDAKVAPEPIAAAVDHSGTGDESRGRKGSAESEGDRKSDASGGLAPSRSMVRKVWDRSVSEVSSARSEDGRSGSQNEEGLRRNPERKGSGSDPVFQAMSGSEQTLLCLFQITRTCGWPPAHGHLLRGAWQGLLTAPHDETGSVASYVTDFLLLCHMSQAESPEAGYPAQGPKKQPGADLPGRKAAGVGLDQRLAKLLLGYLLETKSGAAVLQRLIDGVRSYTLTATAASDGPIRIAWESAPHFAVQPVGQKEHSALILLADAAYHQATLLVPHLPELVHMAIVLLRPRAEHVWAHRAGGSFHLCLESHSLIAHLLHSLAVRYAPTNLARERAQTFLDTYYGPDEQAKESAGTEKAKNDAQRASLDPEERLTTSYLFELISLLQPFRPELRAEWAERALGWAAGAMDKRVIIDSLRVFAVVNKRADVATLVRIERLLLGAVRVRGYAVADSILDVMAKVVARLCRPDPSRSASSQPQPPRGAWEHVTAAALAALSCTNIRMFHKALTMVQVLIEARPEGTREGALDDFWRLPGGSLDESVYELLFPGLLDEKTAAETMSLLETLAKAHALALPADNKLTVLALLLNTALVHAGQTHRCEEALRIVESGGCALADLSATFAAQMAGKYKHAGAFLVPPAFAPPTSPRKQRTTSYTYGQKDKGPGSAPTTPAAPKQPNGKEGPPPTNAEANGAPEEAPRVARRRPSRHAFLDAFFHSFALAFPSEYTWTFSLHALLALVARGPPTWRAPLTDVLSSLLHARAHAWTEANFQAVADVICDVVPDTWQQGGTVVTRSQAQGDIRALLRDNGPPTIAQRVVDAIHPLEVAKAKAAASEVRTVLTLPPGKRTPVPPAPTQTASSDAAEEWFPGYAAGSYAAISRLMRAEKWLEALVAQERRTTPRGGQAGEEAERRQERCATASAQRAATFSSRSLPADRLPPPEATARRSSAEPETGAEMRRTSSSRAREEGRNGSGPSMRLAQPTESSARRKSLVTEGAPTETFADSLRQTAKAGSSSSTSSRDRGGVSGSQSHGGQPMPSGQPVSIKALLTKSRAEKDRNSAEDAGTSVSGADVAAPAAPTTKSANGPDASGSAGMTIEEWTLQSSGQWHQSQS